MHDRRILTRLRFLQDRSGAISMAGAMPFVTSFSVDGSGRAADDSDVAPISILTLDF